MPGKTEHVLFCRLSVRQRALYETYLQSDEVSKVISGSTQLLGALTMLRKICNHPDLASRDGSFPNSGQPSIDDLDEGEDSTGDDEDGDEHDDGKDNDDDDDDEERGGPCRG